MKKYEYNVIYLNDREETIYCNGFHEAIVLAMAIAQQRGWDMRIKYITDEKGITITDIEGPKFKYSK